MKISKYILTGLRILVGWHFLYEGIDKLMLPGWSAKIYLMGSKWIFADMFKEIAASPGVLKAVDFLNIWGLILIGLGLMLGLFIRWASIAGSVLLIFYFVAYPPIPGFTFGSVAEGSYLWVNKTLIELFILLFFAASPVNWHFALDRWFHRLREEEPHVPVPEINKKEGLLKRRELLRDMISLPFIGVFAYALYKKTKWDSYEKKFLTEKPDATSGATLKSFTFVSLENLKGQVPKGKVGNMELGRLILGGNLIGGWAHARDLIYVDKLVKAYHSDERVITTLQLAEKCGIDAILCNPQLTRIINKYWHETGGKIKFISDSGHKDGLLEGIRLSQAGGASAMYCHGEMTDRLVRDEKFDEIIKSLELIRSFGKPAGIGAHRIETIKGCVSRGIKPDFWVKTLHHHDYWSAQMDTDRKGTLDKGFKDNVFCFKPQETIDFMNNLQEPWIAFKVLAAGAIKPQDGFKYAFDNGADFIVVGMYDFQVVEDVNTVLDTLSNVKRTRPWFG